MSAAGYIFNSAADEARKAVIEANRERHDAAVVEEVQILRAQNYKILGTEVYAENPDLLPYLRRYDIVVQDQAGTILGVEVKTTITGTYQLDPRQVEFDVATVKGGTTLLGSETPVNGVMYRGVNLSGKVDALMSTLELAQQLNQQKIPWHYTTPQPGH